MSGLVSFANTGGKGLILPVDIFAWNNGGMDGALDLHDYAMGGDVGYYPQWVNNTKNYLENLANADVNVIIWSWCGQVSSKYSAGTLESEYLTPMTRTVPILSMFTIIAITLVAWEALGWATGPLSGRIRIPAVWAGGQLNAPGAEIPAEDHGKFH